jgi:glycosyltransferase involved in cell wall biosynthesis
MRILHLATHDHFGGAARAAYRQHLALRGEGIDSRMLVRHKHTDDPQVEMFAGNRNLRSRMDRTIRRAWINHCERRSRAAGKPGLTDPRADLLRSAVSAIADADIINIHKTEYFADVPALLASLPASKPVVFTLHDPSPITGGCDYPGSCERFTDSCGSCPLSNGRQENDYSRKIFRMRQAAYGKRSRGTLAFVANSRWTLQQAHRSSLLRDHPCVTIHYGLDTQVYNPRRRQIARQALGLPVDDPVLLFAAHDVSYPRKGAAFLLEALQGPGISEATALVTFGAGHVPLRGHRHFHFGTVNDERLQALIYQAADVFVMPSLEEAFGLTALEAVACGTVVAGFAAGGIADVVQNGLNGMLVRPADAAELRAAIVGLLENRRLRQQWIDQAEPWVKERFSYAVNAARYLELYRQLVGK